LKSLRDHIDGSFDAYTVLRYVHDIATGEFVNVGVVVYAPKVRYLQAEMRFICGRLARVFLDGDATGLLSTPIGYACSPRGDLPLN
jgi:Protein of unknown function (DUF3037)